MTISLIAAMGKNRVIGSGAKMPWHLPDDLAYFMEKTRDHFVLMGRKTYEAYEKILKDHKVILVTSQHKIDSENVIVVHSIKDGIDIAKQEEETELFISGGGQIFSQTINLGDRIYLTVIDHDFDGDVFFPEFNRTEWVMVSHQHHPADDRHAYQFDLIIFQKHSR